MLARVLQQAQQPFARLESTLYTLASKKAEAVKTRRKTAFPFKIVGKFNKLYDLLFI
jgi:hypothetical protein